MSYSASALRGTRTSLAHPTRYARLLCALALTIGLVYPAHRAHAQSAPKAPAAVAAASASTTLEGVLEVQIEDDFKGKKSRTRHFLKTESGDRYELQFKKNPPQHVSGTKVRVKGTASDSTIMLETGGGTSYQYLAAPATGLSSIGAQSTAVLLVNFQDQPTTKPWTVDQWNSFVFGTASGSVNRDRKSVV